MSEAAAFSQQYQYHHMQQQQQSKIKLLEAQLNQVSSDALADRESWLSNQLDLHRQLAQSRRQLAAAQAALAADEAIRADAVAVSAAQKLAFDQKRRLDARRFVLSPSKPRSDKSHLENLDEDSWSSRAGMREYARELARRRAIRQEDWERMRGLSRHPTSLPHDFDSEHESSEGEASYSEESASPLNHKYKGKSDGISGKQSNHQAKAKSKTAKKSKGKLKLGKKTKSGSPKKNSSPSKATKGAKLERNTEYVDDDSEFSSSTRKKVEKLQEEELLREAWRREGELSRRHNRNERGHGDILPHLYEDWPKESSIDRIAKRRKMKNRLSPDSSSGSSDSSSSSEDEDGDLSDDSTAGARSRSKKSAVQPEKVVQVSQSDVEAAEAALEMQRARRLSKKIESSDDLPIQANDSSKSTKSQPADETKSKVVELKSKEKESSTELTGLKHQVEKLQAELQRLRNPPVPPRDRHDRKPSGGAFVNNSLLVPDSASECGCATKKCSPEEVRRLEALILSQQSNAVEAASAADNARRKFVSRGELLKVHMDTANSHLNLSPQATQTFTYVTESHFKDGYADEALRRGKVYKLYGEIKNGGYWEYTNQEYLPSDAQVSSDIASSVVPIKNGNEPKEELPKQIPSRNNPMEANGDSLYDSTDNPSEGNPNLVPLPEPEAFTSIIAPLAQAVNLLSPLRPNLHASERSPFTPRPEVNQAQKGLLTPPQVKSRCILLASISENQPSIANDAARVARALRRASFATADAESKASSAVEVRERLARAISAANEIDGPEKLHNSLEPLQNALNHAAEFAQGALQHVGLLYQGQEELFREADKLINMFGQKNNLRSPLSIEFNASLSDNSQKKPQRRLKFSEAESDQGDLPEAADPSNKEELQRRAEVIWSQYSSTSDSHNAFIRLLSPAMQEKWQLRSLINSTDPLFVQPSLEESGLYKPFSTLGKLPAELTADLLEKAESAYNNLLSWYDSAMQDAL